MLPHTQLIRSVVKLIYTQRYYEILKVKHCSEGDCVQYIVGWAATTKPRAIYTCVYNFCQNNPRYYTLCVALLGSIPSLDEIMQFPHEKAVVIHCQTHKTTCLKISFVRLTYSSMTTFYIKESIP